MPQDPGHRLRHVSSRQNALVKQLRRAFAHGELTADGHCAIESVRVVEEAIRSGLRFGAVFFRQSSQDLAKRLLPQISGHTETLLLPDDVFDSAVATDSPQGVAALVRVKTSSLDDALRGPAPIALVVAGIQDPGNLGTILRSAEAFGVSGVLLTEGTVSQYNAKCVRASAGSVFRVPVVALPLETALKELRAHGVRMLATSSHKGTPAPDIDFCGALALFVGSEGGGVPRAALAHCAEVVTIPHSPRVESLNAAIAASILLYEASRQRGGREEQATRCSRHDTL